MHIFRDTINFNMVAGDMDSQEELGWESMLHLRATLHLVKTFSLVYDTMEKAQDRFQKRDLMFIIRKISDQMERFDSFYPWLPEYDINFQRQVTYVMNQVVNTHHDALEAMRRAENNSRMGDLTEP